MEAQEIVFDHHNQHLPHLSGIRYSSALIADVGRRYRERVADARSGANRQNTYLLAGVLGTGLRVTEALSLSDSNIDFRKGSIDICPGSLYRHRTIPWGGTCSAYCCGICAAQNELHSEQGKHSS